MKPRFTGGPNIAIKVPPHQFESTVTFYRDVLGLEQVDQQGSSVAFAFGANRLWIDRVEQLSKSEVWLEVATDTVGKAAEYLQGNAVPRRDEIEPLPDDLDGFWIADPASNILLVHKDGD